MSHESSPGSMITVEETYTYKIEIGEPTTTTCVQYEGIVCVRIPYDGAALQNVIAQLDHSQ